jgi:hypothetical protein
LASRTCPNQNNVCDVFVLWQRRTIGRTPRNIERTRQLLRESRRCIEHPDAVEDHSGLKRRSDCVCCGLCHKAFVLGIIDNSGLINQHDRDIASDFIPALQSWVVEKTLVGEVQQWALVLGTSEDFE